MFTKLGALALFASLASALQLSVTSSYADAGREIGVDVFVNSPDVGIYDFLLHGPTEEYHLRDNVHLYTNAQFNLTIPKNTPTGSGYEIVLAYADDPEHYVAHSQEFPVVPASH